MSNGQGLMESVVTCQDAVHDMHDAEGASADDGALRDAWVQWGIRGTFHVESRGSGDSAEDDKQGLLKELDHDGDPPKGHYHMF